MPVFSINGSFCILVMWLLSPKGTIGFLYFRTFDALFLNMSTLTDVPKNIDHDYYKA